MSDPIVIIGAGLGGLVLAMGLKQAGMPFKVYERDTSPTSRNQGYYNRYSQFGYNALKTLVPQNILSEMEAAGEELSNESPSSPFSWQFISQDGTKDAIMPLPPAPNPMVKSIQDKWIFIRRDVFRKILLRELEDHIVWDSTFVSFTSSEDSVEVIFQDGTSTRGRLLVGADGANSRVAAAVGIPPPYLSKSEMITTIIDTTPEVKAALDHRQRNTLSLTCAFDGMPPRCGPHIMVTVNSDKSPVTTLFAARVEGFGCDLGTLSKTELGTLFKETFHDFDPKVSAVTQFVDPERLIPWKLRLRSSVPEWKTVPRVTLLGDSVHSMSPAGGNGANMAFVSASLLAKTILEEGTHVEALEGFEASMRRTANMILAGVKQMSVGILGVDYPQ